MNIENYKKLHLGLAELKKDEERNIRQSLYNNYSIHDLTFYNPTFAFINNNIKDDHIFNNRFKLFKLLKKSNRCSINGYEYYALVKKNGKLIKKKIFIKETPMIPMDKFFDHSKMFRENNLLLPNFHFNKFNNYINNYKNSAHIDVFATYLTSKLVENGISPHFPLYYGSFSAIMEKFTIEINDSDDFEDEIDNEIMNIYNKGEKYYGEVRNYPCQFLASENLDGDLYNLRFRNEKSTQDEWLAYMFQVSAALTVCQKYFGLCNNDLHSSNVMYKYISDPFLYYKFRNKYYRIPTYNKLIKIIDWGRATFNWNGKKIQNNVFDSDNDCFGQYIFPMLPIVQKKNIDINNSMDLSLLSSDLLNDDEGENIPNTTNNNLTTFLEELLKDRSGELLEFDEDSFYVYKVIAKNTFSGVPKNQLSKKYFKIFEIKYNMIPKDHKIYHLD